MKLRPLYDGIIVQKVEPPKVSKGGILLPQNAEDYKITTAKVIAVGKGKLLGNGEIVPLGVVVGDTVIFQRYAGQNVAFDGQDYVVIKESDVIGILPSSK